ncbi:methyl-accepting chemotaxis protein [Clostridiaceae bacterium HSG29]|nr:methyl-accepting chemotaxis protein [Clostridiaceae bacterium HSG29]
MRKQLILIFSLVIIVPILLVGFLANKTSSDILKRELEVATTNTTIQLAEYLDMYFEGYNSGLITLSENLDIKDIINHPEYKNNLIKTFDNYLIGHPEVANAYMGTENGDMFIMPAQDLPDGYDPRIRPWYGTTVENGVPTWTDPYVDASSGDMMVSGAMSVFDKNKKLVGVVSLDINIAKLSETVNSKKIGRDGYPILLDSQNLAITHPDKDYVGKGIPIKAITDAVTAKDSGSVFYEYNNQNKFIHFTTLNSTGWTVLGNQSNTEIEESSKKMYMALLTIGLLAILGAFIVAYIYSSYLTKNLKLIVTEMEKIKDGDLNSSLDLKTKTEIGDVADNYNVMVTTLASLVTNIKNVVKNVEEESENLAATSQETAASANEVARAVDEIAQGATSQAQDTDNAVMLTNKLDEQFHTLLENTNNMLDSANSVSEGGKIGKEAVEELKEKTDENNKATSSIGIAINSLNEKSDNIGNILGTISSIAEQTNLLALNASIEAARAGEHGRGFAVVADEIRKLAEESSSAANQIDVIVQDIQHETKNTVSIMNEVNDRSKEQNESVEKVNVSFEHINNSINEIGELIKITGDFIDEMNENKSNIVSAIENISSVSEESAAGAEEVTASMDQQNIAIEDVAKAAEKLSQLAAELNAEMSKFKL